MGQPRLIQLTSPSALRDAAPHWDDLWWRSEVTSPALRAQLVAQWLEQFAPKAGFCALAVEDEGRWVAATPLLTPARGAWLGPARMPSNAWCQCGDLLLDPRVDPQPAMDAMAAGLRQIGSPLLWLSRIPLAAPRWMALRRAAARHAMPVDASEHVQMGIIPIGCGRAAFERGLPKKHLTKMARCMRRIQERGDVRFEVLSHVSPQDVEPWLRKAFEVEDRSWKGDSGTSVLRTPGVLEYYVAQAQQLAQWGQLELAFLHCGDAPVAFVYGYAAKGVSHWQKIGYDSEYACCTPGRVIQLTPPTTTGCGRPGR